MVDTGNLLYDSEDLETSKYYALLSVGFGFKLFER